MTEQEAKESRCCGPAGCGRVLDYEVHRNSVGETTGQTLMRFCIASACMGWRWDRICPPPSASPVDRARYHGHCGLAGKP